MTHERLTDDDRKAAEEYAELDNLGDAYAIFHSKKDFLAGASHIRSTVVGPLEAKLAEAKFVSKIRFQNWSESLDIIAAQRAQLSEAQAKLAEKQESLLEEMKGSDELFHNLKIELSEAQRVIKDFREALEWIVANGMRDSKTVAQETVAKHPAPSEEKAE